MAVSSYSAVYLDTSAAGSESGRALTRGIPSDVSFLIYGSNDEAHNFSIASLIGSMEDVSFTESMVWSYSVCERHTESVIETSCPENIEDGCSPSTIMTGHVFIHSVLLQRKESLLAYNTLCWATISESKSIYALFSDERVP